MQRCAFVTGTTCLVERNRMFKLNPTRLHRIESYAREAGKTPAAVLNQALDYWFENHGEIVLEEMVRRNSRKRSIR